MIKERGGKCLGMKEEQETNYGMKEAYLSAGTANYVPVPASENQGTGA